MITIEGKYNTAKIFTNELEPSAQGQIQTMCDLEYLKDSKIRVMPDVHAGAGCTIGTTMTIKDVAVPNMVGVDIGCGMLTIQLKNKRINLPELDSFIRKNIPAGFSVREVPHRGHGRIHLEELKCFDKANLNREKNALGTLGGGNHFIEVDKDEDENLYLVIHSGSRNPGLKIAKYYQDEAYKVAGGRNQKEIAYELAPVMGELFENYIADMKLMQEYAMHNRRIIAEEIIDNMKLKVEGSFTTVHNYIDTDNMILRKGAVSANKGEQLLIPINMRDGALICTGKGNPDWNCSAPHGSGRLYSRSEAKERFTLSAYKKEMEGIFTTSVDKDTLDECPMAYKSMDYILDAIADTCEVNRVIKPIYNFKAG